MKLLIFGTGMIVNDFLDGVDELELEAVYIYGRTFEKANALKEKFGLDFAFDNLDDALASDADVAYVGLPNNLHYEYTEKALLAGKHVIVEKPFMPFVSQAEKIIDIAKQQNKMIFEASLVFYFPIYKQLLEDLPSLGEVHQADINFSQYSSRYARFLKGDIAPAINLKNYGGALMDLNVYNINFMVGLYGTPEKIHYFPTIKNDIDVNGTAILEYGKLKASCVASKSTSAPRHVILQGEKGTLILPKSMSRAYKYTIEYNDGKSLDRNCEDEHHRMYHEFVEFFDVINNKDFNRANEYINRALETCKVLQECRNYAGIKFPCN